MSARGKFVGIEADFWDCCEAERLTHEDPISALEECVDNHLWRGCDTEKEIRDMGDISVDAYVHDVVPDSEIEGLAELAIERISEALDEDDAYGHPDGDHECLSEATQAKHKAAFVAAVGVLVADAQIWRCSVKTSVVLTPDEVLELMRVERPDWFVPEAKP